MRRLLAVLVMAVLLVTGACSDADEAGSDATPVPAETTPTKTGTTVLETPTTTTRTTTSTEEVDPSLFINDVGQSLFDPATEVVETEGDWYTIVTSAWESTMPVPAGWATNESDYNGTYVMFANGGAVDEESLDAQILVDSDVGADDTFDEYLEMGVGFVEMLGGKVTVAEALAPDIGLVAATLVPAEIDGPDSVFMCEWVFCGDTQDVVHFVFVFVEKPSEDGGEYYQLSAAVPEQEWDRFYPLVWYMVSQWSDADGDSLNVELPDSVKF